MFLSATKKKNLKSLFWDGEFLVHSDSFSSQYNSSARGTALRIYLQRIRYKTSQTLGIKPMRSLLLNCDRNIKGKILKGLQNSAYSTSHSIHEFKFNNDPRVWGRAEEISRP